MRISFDKEQMQECRRALKYYAYIQKQSILVYGLENLQEAKLSNYLYKLLKETQPNEELDYAKDTLERFSKAFRLYSLTLDLSNKQGKRHEKYLNQCLELIGAEK